MNSKSTKRALVLSLLALVMCLSMLIGTTFAWFTDTVTSGVNKIVAGNLDIELYHTNKVDTDEKVEEDTVLFDDIALWEPGAVVFENFELKNEGTLALKYEFSMLAENETVVNGKSIKDALQVAVIENDTFTGNREDAKALTYEAFDSFTLAGTLEAGTSTSYAIVIYWEPTANDNVFNMNNGATTALTVDLGVELVATQLNFEKDSFDENYDKNCILPIVVVDEIGAYFDLDVEDRGSLRFEIPIDAVADGVKVLNPVITVSPAETNVPADVNSTLTDTYEVNIQIAGLKEDEAFDVQYVIPGDEEYVGIKHIYINGVALFSNSVNELASYDPATRTITFKAINNASVQLVMDTGAIVIPESYTNDEAITMIKNAKNGAIIDGNGRNVTLQNGTSNVRSLLINADVTFRNMTLTSNGKGAGVEIDCNNKTAKFINVKFANNNNSGRCAVINTVAKKSLIFKDCTFAGKTYLHGSGVLYDGCTFQKNNNLESASNHTFIGCTFTASGSITMNTKLTNITFEGNTFKSTIRLYSGMPAPVNMIVRNNQYTTSTIFDPDKGVDYEGWKAAGNIIEENNVKI